MIANSYVVSSAAASAQISQPNFLLGAITLTTAVIGLVTACINYLSVSAWNRKQKKKRNFWRWPKR